MSSVAIKGWCPSAHRPMPSGDGLVARIRPRGGRLSPAQALAIADLAERHGNGLIDLTGRANLQIRGLRAQAHEPLLAALAQLALLDADAETESQRNILVAPLWSEGDDTHMLATALERALGERPLGLPAKFGFAVDCGNERLLAQNSADIRIERSASGGLMVRPDGSSNGRPVTRREAVPAALALAKWFLASGGASGRRGRMAAHIGSGARPPHAFTDCAVPARAAPPPHPGVRAGGALVGIAFGQIQSATFRVLAEGASGLRMTPWRMVFVEGLREMPEHEGIVSHADDPLLRVSACSGAPACGAAYAETRALAAALAPHMAAGAHLHVSGCAKGCAHPGAAAATLVAAADGFDLIRNGSSRDAPALRGLTRAEMLADPSAVLEDR
ncbi:precorrin-3B synthase [Bradyrhizobium sp. ARR65]|uniref:precorrin-3B synthase n=1 Tax=Bradyrhizobium sp. ARR65 TaxID=1040989 RepID=UPI0004676311|nr:precorrin-3B synthase [Bradyrhizobium sp. ARR65]